MWGLDLSQTTQGAGGIGGLLAKIESGETHYYLYDGNGNVGQLLSSTGTLGARYEYDPYGNTVFSEAWNQQFFNPFRFSTKYLDTESGLYYYGHRFYDSETGRWTNRDPKEEEGGLNLYSFLVNRPINFIDLLGNSAYSDISTGYLFYTWHMGWLDVNHMKKNPTLEDAWRKLEKAKDGDIVTFRIDVTQPIYKTAMASACIKVKESIVKNQLLYVWMRAQEAFEIYQMQDFQDLWEVNQVVGWGQGKLDNIASGFSTEDLVSDLVGFYSVVNNKQTYNSALQELGAGRFDPKDEIPLSTYIWNNLLKIRPGGALETPWRPVYFDYVTYFNKNKGILSLNPTIGTEEQLKLRDYYRRFKEPRFPSNLKKLTPTSEGVGVTIMNDIASHMKK